MKQLALVGCAHIHTPGFVRTLSGRDDVVVSKVWDPDPGRSGPHAATLGAQQVAEPEAIWFDPEIKGVVISSETNRHQDLVAAACRAGKHLFVEKPLGLGAADAATMASQIEAAGVIFQTGYFMRGFPDFNFARQAVAAGHVGQITRIRLSNCHAGSLGDWFTPEWLWMTDPAVAGVGAFGDLGTHILDILLWLTDARVTGGACATRTALARYGVDCDEYGEALLTFDNGLLATLAAGWVDVADPIKLQLAGTEGHIHIVDNDLYFQSKHIAGADGQTPWPALPARLPHAFDLFLDAVAGQPAPAGYDQIPLVTAPEAARRSHIMAALYQAARSQTWVEIEDRDDGPRIDTD